MLCAFALAVCVLCVIQLTDYTTYTHLTNVKYVQEIPTYYLQLCTNKTTIKFQIIIEMKNLKVVLKYQKMVAVCNVALVDP